MMLKNKGKENLENNQVKRAHYMQKNNNLNK